MTKITRYKQSLYQDWKDGEISQQEYREMKADYERQAAGLSDLLARLTAERKQLSNGVDQQHPALVAFAKYQNIEKLTREILIELVDHIKVYENGNISASLAARTSTPKVSKPGQSLIFAISHHPTTVYSSYIILGNDAICTCSLFIVHILFVKIFMKSSKS